MRPTFGISIFILLLALAAFASDAAGQAKRNSRPPASAARPSAAATPTPAPTSEPKKNDRPASTKPAAADRDTPATPKEPLYRYEFTQPDFTVSHIVIEHDDAGKGTITFRRSTLGEDLTDPIEVSDATLERLRAAFAALDFLASSEDYQYERDFSNMGNIAITLKDKGRERTAKYNWTTNKDAKVLMDEYRRIANQFVWMFDINLARANQPLETPKLVDSFDSLMKRNEIADPHQMLPFLDELSRDERVPLIGRNRLAKLVKQIEKQKK